MRRINGFLLATVLLIFLVAAAVMAQQVHVVQRGESLYQIAMRYDRTVEELARANGISPPYIIHAGNRLTIPARGSAGQAPTQEPQKTTASPETHCYIVGDACIIISNVCFLDTIDCGDGTDWFSQRAWLRGWCMAAIYAGVIVGHVEDCVDGKARTVAEKVPISSVNGMPVLWQHQQYQRSSTNGNQHSSSGGSNQRSSSNGGGNQQQRQQGTGQNGGNQQQELIVLQSENPPQDQQDKIPQDQQDQEKLLLLILNQQQEPQYQGLEGPKGEQEPDKQGGRYPDCEHDPRIKSERVDGVYRRSYKEVPCVEQNPPDNRVDKSGTVSGEGAVQRPNYKPLVPASGNCRQEVNCYNCSWQMETIYGTKSRTITQRVCKVKGEDPCTAYDEYLVNISDTPATTTWKYVCT